jgi:hypothetical protein
MLIDRPFVISRAVLIRFSVLAIAHMVGSAMVISSRATCTPLARAW